MKKRIFFLLIVIISILIYNYYNEDTTELEIAQNNSNDEYLELELGKMRYKVYGNENQNTVVLIHGFNGFMNNRKIIKNAIEAYKNLLKRTVI